MKTPQEKIILKLPMLFKTVKKILPQIRNKYLAKELEYIILQILQEYKLIKNEGSLK